MVSPMQVLPTLYSTVHILNTWILTAETILVLADVASGTDRHLDIVVRIQVFVLFTVEEGVANTCI